MKFDNLIRLVRMILDFLRHALEKLDSTTVGLKYLNKGLYSYIYYSLIFNTHFNLQLKICYIFLFLSF